MRRSRWSQNTFAGLPRRVRRPRKLFTLEALEPRCLLASLFVTPTTLTGGFQPVEGSAATVQVATAIDTDATVTPADLAISIDWGDGTALDNDSGNATLVPGALNSQFSIFGTHTFEEESGSVVPPLSFNVTVTVTDNKNHITTQTTTPVFVLDAPLSAGDPVPVVSPAVFSGIGANTTATFNNFVAAIGGVNNGAAPSPQNGGFRTINWDAVKLDGTDFGGGANTTVIQQGHTVGIPENRFQTRGVFFGAIYAVSGDGFTGVDPNAATLFPSFSPSNTFAMFNDNGIDFSFVAPSATNSTPAPAASRGFGVVFLNVEQPNTTSIELFSGNQLLSTIFAPVGGKGQPVFVGGLFANPIVTKVSLSLGTDVLFSFNGTNFTPGTATDNPASGHNLVATDDFAYAEPVPIVHNLPIGSGPQGTQFVQPILTGIQQIPINGVVATFNDLDPNGNAKDFTATINWGDGHLTNGAISADGHGGFNVTGTNTYATAGTFPVSVDISDFGGGPGVSGEVPTVSISNAIQVGHRIIPSDFDGDLKSDIGVFRPSTAQWLSRLSSGLSLNIVDGQPNLGDIPVPGDYDGIGHTELAVFRPSTGQWIINSPGGQRTVTFGQPNLQDIPVPGDYDGVGHTELAVFTPATSTWTIQGPNGNHTVVFGLPNLQDVPVPGDYDGTGHTELAVFNAATSTWKINSPGGSRTVQFGAPNWFDIPAPGDYDGVGFTELAVFRPSTAQWFIKAPTGGHNTVFGGSNFLDLPLEGPLASLLKLGVIHSKTASHSAGVRIAAASAPIQTAPAAPVRASALDNFAAVFNSILVPIAQSGEIVSPFVILVHGRRQFVLSEVWLAALEELGIVAF